MKIQRLYEKIDRSIFGRANVEDSMALLYHENSKFDRFSQRREGEKMGVFFSPYYVERSSQPFKVYPKAPNIDLSLYTDLKPPEVSFFDIMGQRRSVRDYDPEYELSLFELATLMHQSYGVTNWFDIDVEGVDGSIGFRNVPSPGGLYPLELYVVMFRGQIPAGLYHFRPDIKALEVIKEGDFLAQLKDIVYAAPYINLDTCNALVFTTGLIERISMKYGERGYRFMLHESGFVGMTQSLICEALGLGSCMLGGYLDDKVNEFLEVDGLYETVLNMWTLGKAPS